MTDRPDRFRHIDVRPDRGPAPPRELAPGEEPEHISDDGLTARCGVSLIEERDTPMCPDCLATPEPGVGSPGTELEFAL